MLLKLLIKFLVKTSQRKITYNSFWNVEDQNKIIDEVLVFQYLKIIDLTLAKKVLRYRVMDLYLYNKGIHLLIKNGAANLEPGEFTLRAFRNNKIDLSQAESVADLITHLINVSTHVTALSN